MSSQTHLKLVTKLSFLRNLNFLSILFNYLFFKMWNASQFCVSSLLRGKHDANLPCNVPILVNVLPKQDKKPSFLCHPSYTDQIFLRPIFASFTDKTWAQKRHNFPASFANFLQWLHLNNLFYKTSMLTPWNHARYLFRCSHCEVSETRRKIVIFSRPYIFAKQMASDGGESILSV